MLKQCLVWFFIVSVLTGCMHKPPIAQPLSKSSNPSHSIQETRNVAQFSQVSVEGAIDVHLHTGYRKHQVVLRGDGRDLAQVKVIVDGTTLYIALSNGFPKFGKIHADIQGAVLNRFNYKGVGTVIGNNLHTRYLELYLDNQGTTQLGGNIGLQILEVKGKGLTQISGITSHDVRIRLIGKPKVQLTGSVNLSKLNVDGGGWLSLYWIKSYHLTIRATNAAKIQLAGIVNRLDVELWGNSRFKGRYLRAQRSFVKTHDHSIAEISAVNHQSTLATDASDIFYYNTATTRADFMGFNGSVLNMREWDLFDTQKYNRYNKQFP